MTIYLVQVHGSDEEHVRQVTMEREEPLQAVLDGLTELDVPTLEDISGIEIAQIPAPASSITRETGSARPVREGAR